MNADTQALLMQLPLVKARLRRDTKDINEMAELINAMNAVMARDDFALLPAFTVAPWEDLSHD